MWLVQCEGKDSANYSCVGINKYDAQCSQESGRTVYENLMVSKDKKDKEVISLSNLAIWSYPAGGGIKYYQNFKILFNIPS